jgi:hypothetical protein
MSRIDFDDLVQGAIDGVLADSEAARLREIEASSPELAARAASLRRAAAALDGAERLDPPPFFADDVMRAVRRRAEEPRKGFREALRALFAPVPLAACAATLVLGVVLGGLLPDESVLSAGDRSALTGTALPREKVASPATLDREVFARDGVRGEAVVRAKKGLVDLDVDLDAERAVEVRLDLGGTGLTPRSFSQDGTSAGEVAMSADEVRFSHPAGKGRYHLSFAPGEPAGRSLRLRVGEGEPLELALARERTP